MRLFNETKEALERQTATSEILRVISQSPTDVQPVFDAIARAATTLCEADLSGVYSFDGNLIHIGAQHGRTAEEIDAARQAFPQPPSRLSVPARAILAGANVQVADVSEDPDVAASLRIYRTVLSVPMMRNERPVGAITVAQRVVRPFSDKQIALLQIFADQAVIAIENVRLFKELEARNRDLTEALSQQTATSDILRVISQSHNNVQPVFDTIAESANRLCQSVDCNIFLLDGDRLVLGARHGPSREVVGEFTLPVVRGSVGGRTVLERRTIHVLDPLAEADEFPEAAQNARIFGFRTMLSVPLIQEGAARGVIQLRRTEMNPFSERQAELLKTFADQAVIAIENVRLFKELQEKNQALTQAHAQVSEALEQQTATSEILRVIASSPTDVQPVFDAIVQSATRLCGADFGIGFRFDGQIVTPVALHNMAPDESQIISPSVAEGRGVSATRATVAGRAVLDASVVQIHDLREDPEITMPAYKNVPGYRTVLAVPMLRGGRPIGSINVWRREIRPFSEQHIELLQTFADQAVIAIENVRLFKELEARTQDLTRSVDELTALGEVGRAVSSTLDLETVLSTIVSRAVQLSGTDGGSVYEYDEATEEFTLRASRDLPEAYVEQVRDTRPRKGEGAVGRVAQTREPVQIADISDPAAYESRVRSTLLQIGLRALLAVPLIAENRLVGALIVMRKRSGTFAAEEVALLQTFATQSALAIQNARLFREIEDKSRQLEVASQHKSEFLANMSHELRTPLNAIIGFSEVLSERMFGELNEKQEEYLKDIYASGTHLLSLINDILDLSKIEAGRMELELSDFHLPTALDSAMTLVRERAGRRSIALHMNIDSRLGQIQADERKVRQVVLNLFSNAIKFTPEGGRIVVGAVPKDRFVEVSVSDTGVGIAPEDQEAVFEEFRQVGTADKKVEGTGLGLTLCRKFVELHGGRIWVKSEVGVGSTFTFTIPVRHGR